MNNPPQIPERKKLSPMTPGLATTLALVILGSASLPAQDPPPPPPAPPEMMDVGSSTASPPPAPPAPPEASAAASSQPTEDEQILEGLNAELNRLKEELGSAITGYRITALEPAGAPQSGELTGTYIAPLTLKITPNSGGDPVNLDLEASKDAAGKWTVPSATEVKEALRTKVSGGPAFSGQGVVGSASGEDTNPSAGSVDISAPADLQSVSKPARPTEDITGERPLPDNVTLPFQKNAPVVPLDGEMPSSDGLEPLPSTGKPYEPPVTSLDGPVGDGQPANSGDSLQPKNDAPSNAPKPMGPSLDGDGPPLTPSDSDLQPVEGSGGAAPSGANPPFPVKSNEPAPAGPEI